MPNFPVERPPLAVRYNQDHLLLERVVTGRQVSALTLRPQTSSTPMYDDGGEHYASGGGYAAYGEYSSGGNGGNGYGNGGNGHGNGGNAGNGYGDHGNGGNGGSSQTTSQYADQNSSAGGFGWSSQSGQMTAAEGQYADPNGGSGSQAFWNSNQSSQQTQAGSGMYASGENSDYYLKTARESVELIEEPEPPSQPKNPAVEALGEISLEDSSTNLPALNSDMPQPQELEPQGGFFQSGHNGQNAAMQNSISQNAAAQDSSTHNSATQDGSGASGSGESGKPANAITNPSLHLAGFGAHPGAAISIAIGAGVGALANQMLNKRSPEPEAKPETTELQPTSPVRESVALEPPSSEPTNASGQATQSFDSGAAAGDAVSSDSGAAAEVSVEDFFESNKSELEDFFGPQAKAPEPAPFDMQTTGPQDPVSEPAAAVEPGASSAVSFEAASQRSSAPPVVAPAAAAPAISASTAAAEPVAQTPDLAAPAAPAAVQPDTVAESQSDAKRAEPSNFFGDEDGGFDFFSSPASAAARRSFTDLEPAPSQESATASTAPQVEAPQVQSQAQTSTDSLTDTGAQDRPKVAGPKTATSSKTKLKVDDDSAVRSPGDEFDDASDSDDEEDEDKPKYKPPKRRTFSGDDGTSKIRKNDSKPLKKASSRASDDDSDAENDDDTDTKSGGALGWLEEEIKFVGLTVSRKTAGVLIAVGLFVLVQIPGWVMSFANIAGGGAPQQAAQVPTGQGAGPFGGLSGGMRPGGAPAAMPGATPGAMPGQPGMPGQVPQQQAVFPNGVPVVGGQWIIETEYQGRIFKGQAGFNQSGANFAGQGKDESGIYDISGALQPPDVIMFNKKYDQESRHKYNAHNEVIVFQGKLVPDGAGMKAVGAYQTNRRVGSSFSTLKPARVVPLTGKWRAQQIMIQPTNPQQTAGGFRIPGVDSLGKPSFTPAAPPSSGKPDMAKIHNFFLLVAGGLVVVGVLIFIIFVALFGPSGKLNIWEKQKYIPSQFRPEHMKMVREYGKTLQAGGTPFGGRMEWAWWCFWTPKYLNLPPDIRKANPHVLCIGGGDKGKTRLMASMITHDIRSEDRAVVVIDSDGQLCDLIVEWIASQPEGAKYAKRVVLVDPTYVAGSLAYNPLEMPDDGDLQAASSAIVHGFKAIYTEPPGSQSQWNAQTANILRNAALLLMANGRTLTDLPNLLQDNDFRDIMLEAVERKKHDKTEYITILETWNQYKKLARTDQWINWVEPILNRVGPMLSDGRIRPILTKPVSDLKLKEIIKGKKILIVKVPQGELDQNANLLGSLIVTGIQQAAMALAKNSPNSERPVALYLDEMDSFIEKETIETITSETRRYQIGFVGSIKTLQHLPEDYRNQLTINMGTMAVFALAKKDGDMLGPQMFRVDGRKIKHQTIQNFFNRVNTSPQFELIMDEEKLNIDRIVGQEIQTYFCYRVGTVAGVFKLKAPDFKDIPEKKINRKLVEKMHAITDSFANEKQKRNKGAKDTDTDKAG